MNRGHAFKQLILARLREFFREPIAIFWVYGFPLILACILGLAFSNSKVEPPIVDVVPPSGTKPDEEVASSGIAKILKDKDIDVQLSGQDEALRRLRQGKTTFVIDEGPESIKYI